MDKYEFNIKAEQMRKMAEQGDYKTAMQIADGIDWRRVRNANLLSYVADIYEQNKEYEEAKDILLLAFERAPVGKRFLFKLSEISVKAGDIQDAQEFYREFCEMSPDDVQQYLLRYMILKAKGAPAEQLISSLEEYTSEELDEEWLYTLAKLYSEAGYEEECVRTCDKIMLLFGLGQYVDKAMDLKLQYRSLTKDQMDLVENRRAHEEKLRSIAEEYAVTEDNPALESEALAPDTENRDDAASADMLQTEASDGQGTEESVTVHPDSEYAAESEDPSASDRSEEDRAIRGAAADAVEAFRSAVNEKPRQTAELHNYHMIIEARTREDGLKIAIDEIKYFHDKYGLHYKVAKTDAVKLNARGFAPFKEKIDGKDLIVENAGALTYDIVDEISDYIDGLRDSSSVVLVDVVDHFDRMAEDRPLFIKKFDIVSDTAEEEDDLVEDVDLNASISETDANAEASDAALEAAYTEEPRPTVPLREDPELPDQADEDPEEENRAEIEYPEEAVSEDSASESADAAAEEEEAPVETQEELPKDYYQEMNIDDFATYAQSYAREIDCSLSGKTVLALYERIERMQEEGASLTKQSAEELIEEAADKAEQGGIGKKLTGMFHPKYDKENRLILREENFV